jgi:hypothetical protein
VAVDSTLDTSRRFGADPERPNRGLIAEQRCLDGGLIQRALSSIVAFHSANLPEKVCREVERKTEVSRFVVSDSPVLLICAIEDFTHVAE